MDESVKKRRISSIQAIFMLAVAGVFDLIQFLISFIPYVGWIISVFLSIFVWLTFYMWFKLNGISFLDKGSRLAITFFLGAIIEVIPIINILPGWTLSVVLMLLIIRAEDVIFNKTGKNIEIQKIIKKIR